MGWRPRQHGTDLYHHIYAWGNDRHPVFKRPMHYQKYLLLIGKYSRAFDIDIVTYALMEWHVHLFIYDKVDTISDFIMKLHGDYAQYFNKTANRVGHVFGERFNNKIINANVYGLWLSRYIHRQAVHAGLVQNPLDYPWTSYRSYMGLEKRKFLKPDIILSQFGEPNVRRDNYKEFVLSDNDGPVDWGKRTFKLRVGEDLIEFIGRELGIDRSILLSPHGAHERTMRREAIKTLATEYGYQGAQIARALKLSRMAITKILGSIPAS